MLAKVKLRNFRTAPRKVRLVANLIRGKNAEEAQVILSFILKGSAQPIKKLLDSAIVAAKQKENQLDAKDLYISEITVDEGRVLKRWRPSSRGRVSPILKRSSQISLSLSKTESLKEISKNKKEKNKHVSQGSPQNI